MNLLLEDIFNFQHAKKPREDRLEAAMECMRETIEKIEISDKI